MNDKMALILCFFFKEKNTFLLSTVCVNINVHINKFNYLVL